MFFGTSKRFRLSPNSKEKARRKRIALKLGSAQHSVNRNSDTSQSGLEPHPANRDAAGSALFQPLRMNRTGDRNQRHMQATSASDAFKWRGEGVTKSDDFSSQSRTGSRHRIAQNASEVSESVAVDTSSTATSRIQNSVSTRLPESYYQQRRIRQKLRANRTQHKFGHALKTSVEYLDKKSASTSFSAASSTASSAAHHT